MAFIASSSHSDNVLRPFRAPNFIHTVVTFLYETVPAFGDTWIGCLGDLGRVQYERTGHNLQVADVARVFSNWHDGTDAQEGSGGKGRKSLNVLFCVEGAWH
jgi:hypothetical protein